MPAYPQDPIYIAALARSIKQHVGKLDVAPEVILASFHGLPQTYADRGDPYERNALRPSRHCAKGLGRSRQLKLTFQSRFGRTEWIKPYTDKTVEALARDGVKSIAIVTPGFAADCIETLEEIAEENKEIFHEFGGEQFSYIPCLNDSDGASR